MHHTITLSNKNFNIGIPNMVVSIGILSVSLTEMRIWYLSFQDTVAELLPVHLSGSIYGFYSKHTIQCEAKLFLLNTCSYIQH